LDALTRYTEHRAIVPGYPACETRRLPVAYKVLPVRIGILGAGAIGGLLAARLRGGGNEIVCIDRGEQLQALARNGLTLVEQDGSRRTFDVSACAAPAEAGPLDWLVLAVKAHEISELVPALAALPEHVPILTVPNGIPRWDFQRQAGAHSGLTLERVGRGGAISRGLDPARLVGGVG